MTTKTIYTCDNCKQDQPTRHENGGHPPLWRVAITCAPIDHNSQYHSPSAYQNAEFCRSCVDQLGIMTPLLRADVPEQQPTIDDMIRAIVRDEKDAE